MLLIDGDRVKPFKLRSSLASRSVQAVPELKRYRVYSGQALLRWQSEKGGAWALDEQLAVVGWTEMKKGGSSFQGPYSLLILD